MATHTQQISAAARRSAPPKGVKRPHFLRRLLRREPHIYSAVCKARLFYSRRVAGAGARAAFRRHAGLFAMNPFESQMVEWLRSEGFALAPGFLSRPVADSIYAQADALFHALEIDEQRSYSVQTGERATLEGASYEQLSATEKLIAVRDPLLRIPELAHIAFHPSILRIAANFLGAVPPLYRVTVVRDFPHSRALHSSNFHKDNDESDSLQMFLYLVDIDDTRGPLVYIPGSNRYDALSCRPRLSRDLGIDANDGRLSDEEVLRHYPRQRWAVLRTRRGSLAAIHGNGIHKGPAWPKPGDPANLPRTAIKLDMHGCKSGVVRDHRENRLYRGDLERMSELQRLFAHATVVEQPAPLAARAATR
jgi:Phytanoyl-CoA dioxygenase (PhyH)